MDFKGTIVEESLKDKSILADLKVLDTSVEVVNDEDQTPWLKQWTKLIVEVPEEQAQAMAEKLTRALEDEHAWYADFKNDKRHYIIFKDKFFDVDRAQTDGYAAAKAYGLSLGIPEQQLDFSPEI